LHKQIIFKNSAQFQSNAVNLQAQLYSRNLEDTNYVDRQFSLAQTVRVHRSRGFHLDQRIVGDSADTERYVSKHQRPGGLRDLDIFGHAAHRDRESYHLGLRASPDVVRFNGSRATMLDIIKNGNASTLDAVQGVKNLLPRLKQTLPEGLDIELLSDQSLFVTASINGVVREATNAALLTALMILIFLGDWRSTVIIAISIPLSILISIAVLSALGQTINIMTLGGLALAVGLLVDDATVTIENVHRNMGEKKSTLTIWKKRQNAKALESTQNKQPYRINLE
jgi:hypothetical protein